MTSVIQGNVFSLWLVYVVGFARYIYIYTYRNFVFCGYRKRITPKSLTSLKDYKLKFNFLSVDYLYFITQAQTLKSGVWFATKNLQKNLDLKHIYYFKTFYKIQYGLFLRAYRLGVYSRAKDSSSLGRWFEPSLQYLKCRHSFWREGTFLRSSEPSSKYETLL